jgi:hypothetical protein
MAPPPRTGRRRRVVAVATALATGAGTAALLAPATSSASSHREAPAISADAEVDGTDLYAFVSPDDPDTVSIVASYWPFEEPDGGPNFYKFADDGSVYDINIDSDGDSLADLTYRYTFSSSYRTGDTFLYNTGQVTSFDDPDLNFRQTYDLTRIVEGGGTTTLLDNAPVAPSNTGPASFPDYEAVREDAIAPIGATGQSFAGQSDDAFFLDLRVFDLLYGGDFSEVGQDTLDGYNNQTIALQLPKSELALNGNATRNPVIGIWTTSGRPTQRVLAPTDAPATATAVTSSSGTTQVSRLGNPLVNEVVIPVKDKDRFNASQPVNDAGSFLSYVQDPEVPRLINAIYDVPVPDSDTATAGIQRTDLIEVFLTGVCASKQGCPATVAGADLNSQLLNQDVVPSAFRPSEQLRLNMSVPPTASPNRLGVIGGDLAGFPNGRRLADDVIDVALQVVEGELLGAANDLGDGVDANDLPFLDAFPYVALPHAVAVNRS